MHTRLLSLCVAIFFCMVVTVRSAAVVTSSSTIPDEKWGYVTVRSQAHMFWWVYGAQDKASRSNLPLILWLQGGPGASGTGFGNFEEIGPTDMYGRQRDATWIKKANVLFIDNPVGAGFSYVDNYSALTKDVAQIAEDLFVIFSAILREIPAFKHTPFYVFCESYGGKMTAAFGERLHQGIEKREIDCNFKGVALGDSWISPVDSVMTWGPYLYQFSLLDEKDLRSVMQYAEAVERAVNRGQWSSATNYWGQTENVVMSKTDGVSLYNVLRHSGRGQFIQSNATSEDFLGLLYDHHVGTYYGESLSHFMNTKMKQKLGIPRNVVWGGQTNAVFRAQGGDFMKPVVTTVDKLISFGYKVVVFQGQLDIICDTPGAEKWIKRLRWPKLGSYLASMKRPLYTRSKGRDTQGFIKSYENFSLYYIMNAGHMVPSDNPDMALQMVDMVINSH